METWQKVRDRQTPMFKPARKAKKKKQKSSRATIKIDPINKFLAENPLPQSEGVGPEVTPKT